MARLDHEGTLDKLSEIQTLPNVLEEFDDGLVDQNALEAAAENLMQHLSLDHLDMLHHKFITGELPDDIPEMSDDEGSLEGVGIPGRDSFEATNSLLSSNNSIHLMEPAVTKTSVKGSQSGSESSKNLYLMQGMTKNPKHTLPLKEWTSSVCAVVGSNKASSDAVAMFKLMDVEQKNYVSWGQVLDMFLAKMSPTTDEKLATRKAPLSHEKKFRPSQHSKRESISKIIGVSSGPTFVYILVSKYGHVGIYDEKFRLQRQYDIDIDTDPDSDFDVAASDPGWITDGLWMDNSKHAVYTTSLRTMHFYDASASVHYEQFRAFGFRSIPTCIDYSFDEDAPDEESLLLFGDAAGGLTIVHFLQPLNSLFEKDEVDSVQCLFWPDMMKHAEFAKIEYFSKIHKDGILGLKYLANNKTVITISRDPTASLVIRQINGKFDSYIFKLGWGVRCFDHCASPTLSLIVTGSNDKIVRLWNPVVTSKPIAVLSGHKSGLNDVRIKCENRLIFSYDKEAVLKTWDIDLGYCLQTLALRFPSFGVLGKEIEFGRPALYIETASSDLILATCCEHFTCIDLNQEEVEKSEALEEVDSNDGKHAKFSVTAKVAIAMGSFTGNPNAPAETEQPQTQHDNVSTEEMAAFEPMFDQFLESVHGEFDRNSFSTTKKNEEKPEKVGSAWSSTKYVIKSRTIGRAFARNRKKETDNISEFRLFKEKFTDEDELSLNVLRVQKYSNNSRMKELARDNMPFMALEIHGLEEITLKQDLPHTVNMLQRGLKIRTIDDLVNMRLDLMGQGSLSLGKSTSGATGGTIGGGIQSATSMEMSSMTSGSFDKSSMDGKSRKMEKLPGKRGGQQKLNEPGKSLPMISEKSGTPSEASVV